MSNQTDLQQRVNQLEQTLTETRRGLERQRQTRGRLAKALVAVVVLGSAAVGVRETLAWGGCTPTLPSPLKTFCVGDPALASDINGNFQAVVDWLVPMVGAFGTPALPGGKIIPGTVASTALATTVVQSLVPPGTIIAYGGKDAPAGWLVCDGKSYPKTAYPALVAVTLTTFGGVGNNFNVPDFRGRFLRGWDNVAKRDPEANKRKAMNDGGANGDMIGSVQLDEFKSHTHNFVAMYQTKGNDGSSELYERYGDYWTATTAAGGTETRPLNAYVNYIIKF